MKHLRKFFIPALLCLLVLAGAVTASAVQTGVVTMSNGSVRVELLSDTVIRVEEKVNGGFGDRFISHNIAEKQSFDYFNTTFRAVGKH